MLHDFKHRFLRIEGLDACRVSALMGVSGDANVFGTERSTHTYGGRALTDKEWDLCRVCPAYATFQRVADLEEGDATPEAAEVGRGCSVRGGCSQRRFVQGE